MGKFMQLVKGMIKTMDEISTLGKPIKCPVKIYFHEYMFTTISH
jgi:hypothetical protein